MYINQPCATSNKQDQPRATCLCHPADPACVGCAGGSGGEGAMGGVGGPGPHDPIKLRAPHARRHRCRPCSPCCHHHQCSAWINHDRRSSSKQHSAALQSMQQQSNQNREQSAPFGPEDQLRNHAPMHAASGCTAVVLPSMLLTHARVGLLFAHHRWFEGSGEEVG